MLGVDGEGFASVSIPSCLLGEMFFASSCSLRAADVGCGPCVMLKRSLDLVQLVPVTALHASELVEDLLSLILLVWVWKK